MKNKNNEKGITIISLVITIIVLLILAGIAISMLSGENGILKQAADAKTDTELAQQNEINTLDDYEKIINSYTIGASLPEELNDIFFKQVKLSNNGNSYMTNFDVANLKNISHTTYYVKPNGNNSNDGLTKDTPFKTVSQALSICDSGDTIILLEGMYTKGHWTTATYPDIDKSVNIIGENDKVYVKQGDNHTFTKNEQYDNIYQTARDKTWQVLDITDMQNIEELTEVESLSVCSTTDSSYYHDDTTVYVNMKEDRIPTNDNIVVNREQFTTTLRVYNIIENAKIYLENITIIGGHKGCLAAYPNGDYTPTILAKNCKFLYSKSYVEDDGGGYPAVSMRGCYSIFQSCEASYGNNDGFNYHARDNKLCNSIEINCIASNNGVGCSKAICNGSSTHDGSKILRISGEYYSNYGGNVTDVNAGTISANYSCYAHDSIAGTRDYFDADFTTQQAGAVMYLYSCKTDGKSAYNICAVTDTKIYVDRCKYNNTGGNGEIMVEN